MTEPDPQPTDDSEVCNGCLNASLAARLEQDKIVEQIAHYSNLLREVDGADQVGLTVTDSISWRVLAQASIPIKGSLKILLRDAIADELVRLTRCLSDIRIAAMSVDSTAEESH